MQFQKILLLFALFHSLTSCRSNKEENEQTGKESTEFFTVPPEKVAELTSNQMAKEPSNFLRSQSSSPIHWQPWTPEILDLAERSQRLIFVFVGATSYPRSQILAELLEAKFAAEINEKYVPVLADTEIDPALALVCNALSGERGEAIAFPFLMWLSHEGNPVAWIPVTEQTEENLLLGFRRAQNTVEAILDKSPRYVVENSRYDNERRLTNIESTMTQSKEQELDPLTKSDLFITAQSLSDLYDPLEKTFDNTGGIPPGNLITTLARIAAHPTTPTRLKKDAQTASKESVELLVESAIYDPLDSYFFSRRNSRSFAVPALSKTLKTQAEMLSAMASSPSTPASKRAIAAMLKELEEKPVATYSLYPSETNDLAFFWSINAIENLLTQDELAVAKVAFQLKSLGNIPSSDDPRRNYFRRNSLGLEFFGSELARKARKSQPETERLLASAIEKLSARRTEILKTTNALLSEDSPTLGPKARLLTALVRAYTTSPQSSNLVFLNKTGQEILSDYTGEEGRLFRTSTSEDLRAAPAFAYDYAVTIEALLEWYRVTWDSDLLDKASQLTTILLENYLDDNNYLMEAQVEKYPLPIPMHNIRMVFGPSTWGIAYGVFQRMSALGYEHPKLTDAIQAPKAILQGSLRNSPVVHTDYLLNAFNTLDGYALLVSDNQKENQSLRLALARPEFDSVFTFLKTPNSKNLPSIGNNAAILLKDGEAIRTFKSSSAILAGLRAQLARQ